MTAQMLSRYCRLPASQVEFMNRIIEKLGLSARAYSRILKVARTIADLDGSTDVRAEHIGEAISYRKLDRADWAEQSL